MEGIGERCPNCGESGLDFDVLVESNRIVMVKGVGKGRVDATPEGFVILRDNTV